ncbi:MAG: penicillin binding protein PBP4B [Clostridia bacterium]|nr:penicillin binding protein PBP4B [Clostridia bacterium]
MKKKAVSILLIVILILLQCGAATTAKDAAAARLPKLVPAKIPARQWQLDVTFPDWKGSVNTAFAINNRVGFYGYAGQGVLYLQPDKDCGVFSLYLNGKRVPTKGAVPGTAYKLNMSALTVNGLNTLQVSDIKAGTVRVCVAYPTVIGGTLKDVGLSRYALDTIDQIISSDIRNGFSSAQLAIVKDGRLVYENAWGNVQTYDEKGNPVKAAPVTTETLYDLASNTKMYSVNYAIQYLLTKGKINLDTRIVDILGMAFAEKTIDINYDGYNHVSLATNKAWKAKLTIRDLLKHQGGFPAGPQYFNDRYDCASQYFDSDKGNVLYAGTGADEATRRKTLRQIFRTPLMYEPGTQTVYSDVDYMVLCFCVEAITGKSLSTFLSKVFWKPMGLRHITFNPLRSGFTKDDCAATELMGNSRDGNLHYTNVRTKTLQGEVHDPNAYFCMNGISGHAGLFANATDLAKLASVMLTGGYGKYQYFSRDVIDMFTAPKHEDYTYYGLGWWREGDHGRDRYFGSASRSNLFGHQGFTGTLTVIDPEENLVIVLLTNKIHSKLVPGDTTLNQYSGNLYTTATLGFATVIIEMGLEPGGGTKEIYQSLLYDMVADARRKLIQDGITDPKHPQAKAHKALKQAAKTF